MKLGLAAVSLLLGGCGNYADFTLPAPPHGPPIRYRWEVRPEPVISRGLPGDWDSVDALNPSVVSSQGQLLNLYSGFDGKAWHTGLATSTDGIHWTKQGRILSPGPGDGYIAANGSAIASTESLPVRYWYQAGNPPRIALATSASSMTWTQDRHPALEPGPLGSWDEKGVADPTVIRAGDAWYMFYLGVDRAQRQRLGVARSADGIKWIKLRSNPILELGPPNSFDEIGLGEPAVWSTNGLYWMLYTGRDRREERRIGLATSPDGVHWQRSDAVPILSGEQPWNSKVVCDPSVLPTGDRIRVWFGGGDVARPDERLDGQIGYAELIPTTLTAP